MNTQSPPTSTHENKIIWNQLPDQYKAAKTDNKFKMKIKKIGMDLNVLVALEHSFLFYTVLLVFHCN